MKFSLKGFLLQNRVIPVAVFDDTDTAIRVAELLLQNSVNIIEITLRTREAMESIRFIAKKFPQMVIGAGSVLSRDSLKEAHECGIKFGVSPSHDPALLEYSSALDLPFIPGVSTPTELNNALKHVSIIKIFPVSDLGGIKYIKSVIAPFDLLDFSLVPAGGINDENYLDYLSTGKVIACGMTYMTDRELLTEGNFGEVERRIKKISLGINSLPGKISLHDGNP